MFSCHLLMINPHMLMGDSLVKVEVYFGDVLQITDALKLNGMLITVDIQKNFHWVNNQFSTLALKGYEFGKTFIKWIKTPWMMN